MTHWLRLLCIVYWTGLILWIGAILTTGISAYGAFGVLPNETVLLERFAEYPQEHHGRLAAGLAMQPIFALTDLIQFGAAAMVIFSLIGQALLLERRMQAIGHIVRGLAILFAAATLIYQAMVITPQMNQHLNRYWEEAERGHVDAAELHRAEFDALHPRAERVTGIRFGLLIIASMASAATMMIVPLDQGRQEGKKA